MKKIFFIIFVVVIVVNCRLWLGVYEHDEFPGEGGLFYKHRPTLKWQFYSPRGMSDLKLEEMTPEKRKEQLLFNEFVRDRGYSR